MREPPPDLDVSALRDALVRSWGLAGLRLTYAPVGFGSHHWVADCADGSRRFVTVDMLADAAAVGRLRTAMRTVRALVDEDHFEAAVAPLPASDGAVLHELGRHVAVAVFPFVPAELRAGEVDLGAVLARLHSAERARAVAAVDDLAIDAREDLLVALGRHEEPWSSGPYAVQARDLLRKQAATLRRLLMAYDRLVAAMLARGEPWVVTHGEPKPDNVIATARGPVLVDWDTVLVAPAARDLWWLADSALASYRSLTGRVVAPSDLELFALRWELTDIALYTRWFVEPHRSGADSDVAWQALVETCAGLARWDHLLG